MPHFTIGDAAPIPPVAASLTVDEDGDLVLTLDGIEILYVDRDSGTLNPYYVFEDDKNALVARGISFTDTRITVEL